MLEKPETSGSVQPTTNRVDKKGEESEDEFEGLDIDLAMLLDCTRPLFQSRNAAVVLAAARTYYHIAPSGNKAVGQELLVQPLLRLTGSSARRIGGEEIAALTWEVIGSMIEERPVSSGGPDDIVRRLTHSSGCLQNTTRASSFMQASLYRSRPPRFGPCRRCCPLRMPKYPCASSRQVVRALTRPL
jgi:hypothetical protein